MWTEATIPRLFETGALNVCLWAPTLGLDHDVLSEKLFDKADVFLKMISPSQAQICQVSLNSI